MAVHEIVLDLVPPVIAENGRAYRASVIAEAAADGHWNVRLEFVARDSHEVLRTGIETHQATEHDLHHWAQTLGNVYLRGALERAALSAPETAAHREAVAESGHASRQIAESVDLYGLLALGEHALRRELQLFARAALRALIIVHDLNPAGLDVSKLTRPQLVTFIVTAVASRNRPLANADTV